MRLWTLYSSILSKVSLCFVHLNCWKGDTSSLAGGGDIDNSDPDKDCALPAIEGEHGDPATLQQE